MAVIDIPGESAAPLGPQPSGGGLQAPVLTQAPGIRVDFGPALHNTQAPQIPKDFASGLFQGSQALAEGLQHVGGFLSGVVQKIGEAQAQDQLNKAELSMTQAKGDFETWKTQNPDPTQWGGEWNKRQDELLKSVIPDNASPIAKRAIQTSFSKFGMNMAVDTQTSAAKQVFSNAKESGIANAMSMVESGQYGAASAKISALQDGGYIHPLEGWHLQNSIKQKHEGDITDTFKSALATSNPENGGYAIARGLVEKGASDNVIPGPKAELMRNSVDAKERNDGVLTDIQQNPSDTLRRLESFGEDGHPVDYRWMSPAERMTMSGHARSSMAVISKGETDNFNAAAMTGAIKDDGDARKFFTPNTPSHIQEALVSRWRNGQPDTKEQFQTTQSQILGFDPDAPDAKWREAELRRDISATFSTQSASVLTGMLNDHLKPDRPDKADSAVKKFVSDSLLELHHGQLLGVHYKDQDAAIAAVHDPSVLEAFGIKPIIKGWFSDDKDAVLKTEGPGALDVFRKEVGKLSKGGKSPIVTDKYNTLSPDTQALMQRVLRGSVGTETLDNLRIQSAGNMAQLQSEFNAQIEKRPEMTVDDARKWIDDVAGRYSVQNARSAIKPRLAPSAPQTTPIYPKAGATSDQLRESLKKYGG